MIIDAVSDLHGHLPRLQGGDLLIVAGDLTARDTQKEIDAFDRWLESQPYRKKIFITGNHDNRLSDEKPRIYYTCFGGKKRERFEYLRDSETEFEGLKIWGTPWSSQFPGINPKCCAFTYPFMESLSDKWDKIPDDVDILITHTPPLGILDTVEMDYTASCGDKDLRETLEKRIKPKLHVFGHIHEHGGKQMIFKRPGNGTENNTICVNASYVNEHYYPVNKSVRIEI